MCYSWIHIKNGGTPRNGGDYPPKVSLCKNVRQIYMRIFKISLI